MLLIILQPLILKSLPKFNLSLPGIGLEQSGSDTGSLNYTLEDYLGDFIPQNVSTSEPTVNVGNKLFHFNGAAKNISGA